MKLEDKRSIEKKSGNPHEGFKLLTIGEIFHIIGAQYSQVNILASAVEKYGG